MKLCPNQERITDLSLEDIKKMDPMGPIEMPLNNRKESTMKKLWSWLWKRRITTVVTSDTMPVRLVYIQKTPAIPAETLLEIFAVDPETPWLLAVLSILAGREEIQKEQAAICELPDSERAFYSGGVREMADAQEQILDLVKKGNELMKGRKTAQGTKTK